MTEWYISNLYANKVGLFTELKIEFNKKFNFIVGSNGSGKTSILRCIGLSVNPNAVNTFRYGEESELWVDLYNDEEKNRIGFGKGWITNFDVYRNITFRRWTTPPHPEGVRSLSANQIENLGVLYCPLIIGAYRKINYSRIEGMKREGLPLQQREYYRNRGVDFLDGISLPNVKQWLINRLFVKNMKWGNLERLNWEWLTKNLNFLGPRGSNLKFISIGRDYEPLFSIYNVECYLEELSAGYQSVLSLIFAIFNWIEAINEEEEDKLVCNASGTVIIDELDVHMHPEWQLTIRNAFEKMFPKLQFIVTTHSPHIIASAKENEIIILPEFSREIDVKPSPRSYQGWKVDNILQDIMGVSDLESNFYNLLYNKALNNIDSNNKEELKETIQELKKVAHRSDIIVKELEIKYASMFREDENDSH